MKRITGLSAAIRPFKTLLLRSEVFRDFIVDRHLLRDHGSAVVEQSLAVEVGCGFPDERPQAFMIRKPAHDFGRFPGIGCDLGNHE